MNRITTYLQKPLHIAPLATFRVLFGAIMLISVLRFILKGWVQELYVDPTFYFSYAGFEWVKPLGEVGMYGLFILMAIAAGGIMLGLFYRLSAGAFFLSFTYVELIDKTNYLNHYYFVSIVAFLLILVPAGRYFSLDVMRKPDSEIEYIPRWMIGIFRLQLGMVYFFAGIAKINSDWLLRAMPMKIWLPAKSHLPLIGAILKLKWVAFAFSWMGMLYDVCIPFLLMAKRTRWLAYGAVIGFHLMTWMLFQIGMFPFIMILSTLIFFPAEWHQKRIQQVRRLFGKRTIGKGKALSGKSPFARFALGLICLHFSIQFLLPFRYLAHPGELFWTENGYRFSWRVMLMEKAGYAIFEVENPETGKKTEVVNANFLTPNQEKMMATQPDMILQFAQHIEQEFAQKGIENPRVFAKVYVTLNGSGTRPFTRPEVNLAKNHAPTSTHEWIYPWNAEPQPFITQKESVNRSGGKGGL